VPHPGSHYENGEQPGTHLGGSDFQLAILLHAYPDPQAALEAFRGNPDQFEAVISDLVMPNLSGIDIVREFRAIRPDMPIALNIEGNAGPSWSPSATPIARFFCLSATPSAQGAFEQAHPPRRATKSPHRKWPGSKATSKGNS